MRTDPGLDLKTLTRDELINQVIKGSNDADQIIAMQDERIAKLNQLLDKSFELNEVCTNRIKTLKETIAIMDDTIILLKQVNAINEDIWKLNIQKALSPSSN